jgi:membrane protein
MVPGRRGLDTGGTREVNPAWLPAPLVTMQRRLREHELFVQAAAVAYAAVLSIFPLAITVIASLGRFVEQARAQQAVVDALRPYLPPEALISVRDTLESVATTRGTAGLIGTLGLLWAATAVAGTLRHALNRVLDVRQPRGYIRRKFTELGMVLLGGVFLSLSITSSIALEIVGRWAPAATAASYLRESPVAAVFSALAPWLFSGMAFFIIYRFLPNARSATRSLLAGTAVAVVLFEGVKLGFFWYLRTLASYPVVYGPIAGVIVFMVWIYLVAVLVLIGAEIMGLLGRPLEVNAA